jgi:hypothetical protein
VLETIRGLLRHRGDHTNIIHDKIHVMPTQMS